MSSVDRELAKAQALVIDCNAASRSALAAKARSSTRCHEGAFRQWQVLAGSSLSEAQIDRPRPDIR